MNIVYYIGLSSRDTVTAAALTLFETVHDQAVPRACKTPRKPCQEIREPRASPCRRLCPKLGAAYHRPCRFCLREAVDYTEPQAAEESLACRKYWTALTTEQRVELLRGGDLQNQTPGQHQIAGACGKTAITLQGREFPASCSATVLRVSTLWRKLSLPPTAHQSPPRCLSVTTGG